MIGLNNPPHSEYDASGFSSEILTVRSIYLSTAIFFANANNIYNLYLQ